MQRSSWRCVARAGADLALSADPGGSLFSSMLSPPGMSRFRRVVRLSAVCVLGASLYAGCSVDDRVLSDEDLGSSGSGGGAGRRCPVSGDNACERCLYASCCEEVGECGPGSACALYLACADGCAGEMACLNRCAAESPAGFGDALALGVCSQSQCSVCSGEGGEAFESCDPNGFGACQSVGDCSALEDGALESLDVEACPECDDLGAPACASCLSSQTGLSEPCSGCVADWLSCAVVNCVLECQVAADSTACSECLAVAGCNTQLDTCGFSG